MPVGLRAIYPKKAITPEPRNISAQVERQLRNFGLAVAARMQYYPTQTPTPYRRTGDYGRNWVAPGSLVVTYNSVSLVNRLRYAVFVGGPKPGEGPGHRQAMVMARKGWRNISEEARAQAKRYKPILNRAITGRENGPNIRTDILGT